MSKPLEAECKYRVSSVQSLETKLRESGAVWVQDESHRDTYLRHPARNFRETDEALRIREIDGQPWITYKGPRLPGPIKVRSEIELPLSADSVDAWLEIWTALGFTVALTVRKRRAVYRCPLGDRELTVTIDRVDSLGEFAEIERILADPSEVDRAREDISTLADRLELTLVERRSYLGMLLAMQETGNSNAE